MINIPGLQPIHGRYIAVFTSTTLIVFLVKKALVTYAMRLKQGRSSASIPCAVLKARLRLVPIDIDPYGLVIAQGVEQPSIQRKACHPGSEAQLRVTNKRRTVYEPETTLLSGVLAVEHPPPWWTRPILGAIAIIGLVSTVSAWVVVFLCPDNSILGWIIGAITVTCSELLALTLLSFHCQRDLLFQNMRNFDLHFSAIQHHVLAVCLCDLMQWRQHLCLAVVSWWLWFFVVLTLDSMTPLAKVYLGLHKRHALLAILVALLVTVAAFIALAMGSHGHVFVDRVLIHITLSDDYSFELRTAELALQRAVTMLAWNLRVPLELATSHDDELTLMRDHVEYLSELASFGSPSRTQVASIAVTAIGPCTGTMANSSCVTRNVMG